MARYRYSKFTGDDLDGLDLEDLLSKLSDMLLGSGFDNPYGVYDDDEPGHSWQSLHDAILEAILSGGLLSDETLDQLLGEDWRDADDAEKRLEALIQKIIDKLQSQGYVSGAPDMTRERAERNGQDGGMGDPRQFRFEITDKSLDFLGYKALRDLLGSVGRSSLGRHDTREMATGIEASGAPKPYEFGDTMNLDASATILNAVLRTRAERGAGDAPVGVESAEGGAGKAAGLAVDYQDLMVAQGEYQSSCATVLMLDCSHSMILYGEDRFTPAKRVALALANLIRLQYPGDALKVVLFHDSAEEIPLSQLARVRVGPYYTNTREGLRMARRILDRQQKDMRQIVMITDGKPSALTRPDGRIYRNAFGLDPFIVSETFAEVAACRKSGILINTFMLARDPDLVSFVRRVAQICHGKAYFTTPRTLGRYVLMDYMDKKTRTVH
jgi:Ca-activated chloride channel family protein